MAFDSGINHEALQGHKEIPLRYIEIKVGFNNFGLVRKMNVALVIAAESPTGLFA